MTDQQLAAQIPDWPDSDANPKVAYLDLIERELEATRESIVRLGNVRDFDGADDELFRLQRYEMDLECAWDLTNGDWSEGV